MTDTTSTRHNHQQTTATSPKRTALIIGASGGIGKALYDKWLDSEHIDYVIGISRSHLPDAEADDNRSWLRTDYSTDAIQQTCTELADQPLSIRQVCICNGVLHNEAIRPEKKIEDLDFDMLQQLFSINTLIPMLWLQALLPLIKGKQACTVAMLSARIGSIQDNRSGGWYGYRASKAALNMMLKTAAVEFSRRARNVKLVAFHPGTTDTNLSRPFQSNIKYEINTPEHVASSLIELMQSAEADGEASFIDWQGEPIEW